MNRLLSLAGALAVIFVSLSRAEAQEVGTFRPDQGLAGFDFSSARAAAGGVPAVPKAVDLKPPAAPFALENAPLFAGLPPHNSLYDNPFPLVNWIRDQGVQDGELTPAHRMSACGLYAAEALERFWVADANLNKIGDILEFARDRGWWADGMKGAGSEQQLMWHLGAKRSPPLLSINVSLEWVGSANNDDPAVVHMHASLRNGYPVIISTLRHYFFVQGYNSRTGRYFVGPSGRIMGNYGGREWMTLPEIGSAGNWSMAILVPQP
ncbi:MAG: hypothetical protein NTX64_04415 [Elusimicrobia bacterium]|nr:hypothetical protein [Elusimicrobiota bacterium]